MSIQHNLNHLPAGSISAQVAGDDVVDTCEVDIKKARAELVDVYDKALQKVIGALRTSGNFGAPGASGISQVH